jgi:hypothetical protein
MKHTAAKPREREILSQQKSIGANHPRQQLLEIMLEKAD